MWSSPVGVLMAPERGMGDWEGAGVEVAGIFGELEGQGEDSRFLYETRFSLPGISDDAWEQFRLEGEILFTP